MKTRYSLDTHVLLRYLLEDNKEYARQVADLLKQAKEDHISITLSVLVFVEAIFVLTKIYALSKEEVVDRFIEIAQSGYIEIQERSLVCEALKIYKLYSISFIDAYLALEAKVQEKTFVTFDKKLQKIAPSL